MVSIPANVSTGGQVKSVDWNAILAAARLATQGMATRSVTTGATKTAVIGELTACDATAQSIAVTLPASTGTMDQIIVKKIDTSANTVAVTGKIDTVAGAVDTLRTQNQAKVFQGDGSGGWYVIGTDISVSALDGRYAGTPTTSAAFSMGGCVSTASNASAGAINLRERVQFPVTPTRFRVRFRNSNGLTETAGTATFTINGGALAPESATTDGSFAAAPTLTFGASSAVTPTATAEYVTPWITNDGSIKANTPLLLSFGLAYSAGTFATTTGANAWVSYSDGTNFLQLAATGALGNYSALEKIIEYEYVNTGQAITALFVGDSLTDTYSGSGQAGWFGQVSGYPNKWARAHRSVAVVNAFTSAKSSDFASGSNKWGRFPTITPDVIFVHLGSNDIASYTPTSGSLANYQTLIGNILTKLRSLYPLAPIYLSTIMPTTGIAADASSPTQESVRQAANAWLFTLGTNKGVAGVIDFDRAVRGTTITAVDANFASGDGIHLNPRGWDKQADVVRMK